jgi:hypothetical protein
MRQRRYQVITNQYLDSLEREVNQILENGGELVGGIACVKDSGAIVWSQAVLCWY